MNPTRQILKQICRSLKRELVHTTYLLVIFVQPLPLKVIVINIYNWKISGPEFILTQFCPCAIVKMITKVRHIINGHGDLDQIKHLQENHTVTILDARKHNPGTFSETGFTLVKLDEVWFRSLTGPASCSRLWQSNLFWIFQEPGTKNWRYGSQDIHLFQEMMNPHLMKLYPDTKVVCS